MTKQKSIITPFARKYLRVISGNLQFENEEKEKFDAYI